MKKNQIKNIIFDLGAVMFEWNPKKIAENFTSNVELQEKIQTELFYHQDWIDFDCALITEQETIRRVSKKFEISIIESEDLFKQIKQSLVLIEETLAVLKKVKEKNLNAYCLSNISPELFKHLKNGHDFFELFDGIVTSGIENTGKPGKQIFEILLDRYQLNAQECFFIDDSEANTRTAESLGIDTITFKGSNDCYQKIYTYI